MFAPAKKPVGENTQLRSHSVELSAHERNVSEIVATISFKDLEFRFQHLQSCNFKLTSLS